MAEDAPDLNLLLDKQPLHQFPVVLHQAGVVDPDSERQGQAEVRVTHSCGEIMSQVRGHRISPAPRGESRFLRQEWGGGSGHAHL